MFHRVLEPSDPRWAHCDPDYTLRADLFDQCLRFFRRHYNLVSADDVLQASRGRKPLPARAMLVTFDDGWADNVDFALPRLRAQGVPGLMFVVSDAVGSPTIFYQERIVSAWRRGTLSVARLAELLQPFDAGVPPEMPEDAASLRELIARVEKLEPTARGQLLDLLGPAVHVDQRQMVTVDELHLLQQGGVSIGLHGKTHAPMTGVADLDAELSGARAEMAARLRESAPPATMSFPHGRYDERIAGKARQAGFELVFTSVPVVNPVRSTVGWLLGRLGFEADAVTDAAGRFRPDRLALYLFRRPHRLLA